MSQNYMNNILAFLYSRGWTAVEMICSELNMSEAQLEPYLEQLTMDGSILKSVKIINLDKGTIFTTYKVNPEKFSSVMYL